jgi:hypothetical protein
MFFVLARMEIRLQRHCDALGSRIVSLVILPFFDSIKLNFFVCSTTSQISEFNTITFQLVLKLLENTIMTGLADIFAAGPIQNLMGQMLSPRDML